MEKTQTVAVNNAYKDIDGHKKSAVKKNVQSSSQSVPSKVSDDKDSQKTFSVTKYRLLVMYIGNLLIIVGSLIYSYLMFTGAILMLTGIAISCYNAGRIMRYRSPKKAPKLDHVIEHV